MCLCYGDGRSGCVPRTVSVYNRVCVYTIHMDESWIACGSDAIPSPVLFRLDAIFTRTTNRDRLNRGIRFQPTVKPLLIAIELNGFVNFNLFTKIYSAAMCDAGLKLFLIILRIDDAIPTWLKKYLRHSESQSEWEKKKKKNCPKVINIFENSTTLRIIWSNWSEYERFNLGN